MAIGKREAFAKSTAEGGKGGKGGDCFVIHLSLWVAHAGLPLPR